MRTGSSLSRLRAIRDAERRVQAMRGDKDEVRNTLVRDAVKEEGHSERMVAEAAGLSPGRINQIVHSD